MQNQFAFIQGDTGQALMVARAAPSDKSNYAFKIDWGDTPSGGSTPTIDYFVGLVMNWNRQGGTANVIRMINSTVEINSNIARTDAA